MSSSETCFHCGLPNPVDTKYQFKYQGKTRNLCCQGCEAVAKAIVANGLTDFYKYRQNSPGTKLNTDIIPPELTELKLYDRPELQHSFVSTNQQNQKEAALILEGIACAACIWLNERHLAALVGVKSVAVNYSTRRARIEWNNDQIKLSGILEAITRIGYLAHPYDPSRQQQLLEDERKQQLRRLGLAGVLGMQVMMIAVALYLGDFFGMEAQFEKFFYWISLGLTLPVMLYSAQPFFRAALRDDRVFR